MSVRLGVLGAGSWAVASHLPVLAKRDDVVFTGVCRKGHEGLMRIKDHFGFAMASEDYSDVLDAGVDVVVVSGPTATHFEHARAALLAGAHVLVEKPFTLTSAEAWELVRLAAEQQRHIVVAFGYNYRPPVLHARSALAKYGGVGSLESLSISMSSVCRDLLMGTGAYPKAAELARPEPSTWADPALSGGGYAQAQLSHALGIALALFEVEAVDVVARFGAPRTSAVELHCAATITWTEGAVGTITGDATFEGANQNRDSLRVEAVGDAGQFQLDMLGDGYRYFRADGTAAGWIGAAGAGSYDCVGPPNRLVDLATGSTEENLSDGRLGARTVEVLEAIYRSAATGLPVRAHSASDTESRA